MWKRVMDMNDRALRFIDINTSGVAKDFKRVDGFDITVASEVMAIFCLSNDLNDLECMNYVGFSIAVNDADERIIKASDLKLKKKGGEGVVKEIYNLLNL